MRISVTLLFLIFLFPSAHAFTVDAQACLDLSKFVPTVPVTFNDYCTTKLRTVIFVGEVDGLCKEMENNHKDQAACVKKIEKHVRNQGSFSDHFTTAAVIEPIAPKQEKLNSNTIRCILEAQVDCFAADYPTDLSSLNNVSNFILKPAEFKTALFKPTGPSTPQVPLDECDCMKQVAKHGAVKAGVFDFQSHVTTINKDVNKAVFGQASRNFLNDFANQLEDSDFHNLGKGPKISECSPSRFQERVNKKCSERGLDTALKDKRIEEVFGSNGSQIYGDGIGNKLTNLQFEIMNMSKDTSAMGPHQSIPRKAYDVVRKRSRSEPEYALIQQFFIQTDLNPVAKKFLNQKIEEGKTPFDAYQSLLSGENPVLNKVFDAMIAADSSSPIMQKFKTAHQSKDKKHLGEFWSKHLRNLINIQPSAKLIFGDGKIFNKFMSESKDKDILAFTDKNADLFKDHYNENCGKLVERLSELICVQDSDFKNLVNRDDLKKVMNNKIMISSDMQEFLLCKHELKKQENSPFDRLASGLNKFLQSDYQDRKLNPSDKQTNGYSMFVNAMYDPKKKEARKYAAQAIASDPSVTFSNVDASTLRMLNLPEKMFTKSEHIEKNSIAESIKAPERAPASREPVKMEPQENIIEQKNNAYIPEKAVSSNHTPASVAPAQPVSSNANPQWKDELRDYLAQNEEKSRIDKLMSSTKDDDLNELSKMRAELSNENKKVLEAMYKLENQKYQKLAADYKNLEEESQHKPSVQSPQVKSPDPVMEDSLFENSSKSAPPVSFQNSSGDRSNSFQPKASESSEVSSKKAVVRPDSSRQSASASPEIQRSGENFFLVVSEGLKSEDPKDLSSELINFLNEKNPDIETLQKIRDSKLIYKYKLAQDGKELQKEIIFDYASLSEDARKLLESKINEKAGSKNVVEVRRTYSVSALKLLMLSKMLQQ